VEFGMDFNERIGQELDKLNQKQLCQFAWLCGLRVLSFLSVKRGFSYWPKQNRQEYLYSIFYALDVSALVAFTDDFSAPTVDNKATIDATKANVTIPNADVIATKVLRIATGVTTAATKAIKAAIDAVKGVASLAIEAYNVTVEAGYIKPIDWENLLLYDIEAIKKNKLDECNYDINRVCL
jgi:hypothetical protein